MTLVVTATNATVANYRIPQGVMEFPLYGELYIVTEEMAGTNVQVGASDMLFVGPQTVDVIQPDFEAGSWLILGLSLVFATAGMVGLVRRAFRMFVTEVRADDL